MASPDPSISVNHQDHAGGLLFVLYLGCIGFLSILNLQYHRTCLGT